MRHVLPALILTLPLGPAASLASEPGLHSFTLDNGLMVVVIEDHRVPAVTQMVWYRVGAADDPAGQSGMAHFLEHLMFKATRTLADGEYDRTVEANGGSFQAVTSIDHTAFTARVAADRLDLVMGMEADRMVNLAPSEASVLSERDVVIEERRQVVDGDPGGAFHEALKADLYPDSPDGRSTIGPEDEIAGLTPEGAMAFYRAHYAPNNAILIVAGDADADEVRQTAEKHFGPIPASALAARPERPQGLPHRGAAPIEVHDARVSVAQLTRVYLAPQRRAGDQKQAAALVVLADLLGGERVTSIMARELVGADGIALAAGASYADTGLNRQAFALYVVPKPGVGRTETEAALDGLIARLLEQGPDPVEIERIRGRARGVNVYTLDDVSGRAHRVGVALTSGLTLEDVEAWPELLESVTVEDVAAAARDVFRNESSVTGWLMPPDLADQGPPQ
jgi:zinc protease